MKPSPRKAAQARTGTHTWVIRSIFCDSPGRKNPALVSRNRSARSNGMPVKSRPETQAKTTTDNITQADGKLKPGTKHTAAAKAKTYPPCTSHEWFGTTPSPHRSCRYRPGSHRSSGTQGAQKSGQCRMLKTKMDYPRVLRSIW